MINLRFKDCLALISITVFLAVSHFNNCVAQENKAGAKSEGKQAESTDTPQKVRKNTDSTVKGQVQNAGANQTVSLVDEDDDTASKQPRLTTKAATAVLREYKQRLQVLEKTLDEANKTAGTQFDPDFNKNRDQLVAELLKLQDKETKSGNLDAALELREAVTYFKKLKPVGGSRGRSATIKRLRNKVKELTQTPASQPTASAGFSISPAATMGTLAPNQKVYANRKYTWKTVPDKFKGWMFTMHSVRSPSSYEIDVQTEGNVFICFSTYAKLHNTSSLFVDGWARVPNAILRDDGDWIIASKFMSKGRHKIPSVHPHSGSVIIMPAKK